ncbi:AMP-binding protein [Caldimonas sp. KR1-144]|uniref:AMP-binding protein n=1 Tax=Caldimonas sp. KR1-144 TaxID=3400911 RepID=UPI003C0669C0
MLTWPQLWQSGMLSLDIALAAHAPHGALAARRARRLAALMAAARGSAFWRERFARYGPAFEAQPPLGKAELMARFDDSVCDRRVTRSAVEDFMREPANIGAAFAGRYTVWQSSGSSGVAGLFVQDEAAMGVYDALESVRRLPSPRRWLDPALATERIAFVGATGGHFASIVSVERLRRLLPGMVAGLRAFSFLEPLPRLRAALQAWQPTIVATYPSAAVMLAEEAAAGRLALSLREVWTGGEALGEGMRAFVAGQFGCAVLASYGASEFMALASECGHRRLHLNSDWVVLEPVDERGLAVPPGSAGHTTLLTNLANHVQPLIRYDLGDRVCLHDEPCDCGSALPVIEVEGRVDDALQVRGDGGRGVCLPPLALTTVIEDEGGWFDFQLVQRGPRSLRLTLAGAADDAAARRAGDALRAYLGAQGAGSVRLEVRCGAATVRGRSGKLPRVVAHA